MFIEDGYQGATYQKIARRAGVSRTTLYQYFRNKQEIFAYAVKQVTDLLEQDFLPVLQREDLSPSSRLEQVMVRILRGSWKYRSLLAVIFDYLTWLEKTGESSRERVRRRTVRLRLTLMRLVTKGQRQGEFPMEDAGRAAEMLLALLEGAMLRLVLGYSREPEYSIQTVKTALEALKTGSNDGFPG